MLPIDFNNFFLITVEITYEESCIKFAYYLNNKCSTFYQTKTEINFK